MPLTVAVATIVGVLLGFLVGYARAGLGGLLIWGVLWGISGLLIGRAIVSSAALLSRFWHIALAIILFVLAVLLTWGLRF